MKSAEEIILEIQELPPQERQKVEDFVTANKEEEFKATYYPPGVIQMLLQEAELSKKRIDTFECSSADELCKSLGLK
ncbi:MAG: hypothetical protein C4527_22280 [Candidatus Omnitrophota bacterium]|jgi:hypothetical protein|nr:MAG: hypothetical protein C4527_22280 [Candidatus Omnitrophota bacterium]